MSSIRSVNPATEALIREYPEDDDARVEALLNQAVATFRAWRQVPIGRRSAMLHAAADVLRSRRHPLARLMMEEMGKPITAARAEIDKCADCCDHFAEQGIRYLADEPIPSDAARSYVRYEPLGPVLAIMPWNFPFWQVFRFAAPALLAGNVGILKHAPNVPGCAQAIEEVFLAAGCLQGAFTALRVDAGRVEAIIQHDAIRAVTLTGSTRAGSAVAGQAGRAIKKVVLELGGSDPFIVLPPRGASLEPFLKATAEAAALARCINTGQSCIAAKRFIVVGEHDRFAADLAEAMRRLVVGSPEDRQTQVGPMARLDLLESLASQVDRSIKAGATCLTGGRRMPRKGFFYEPTVLTNVRPGMAAFDEETFGPVAAVIGAATPDEAVKLANASTYGLGASIWSNDIEAAEALASRIEAGSVFINGPVKSDPRLPFGGIKGSGYGRELAAAGIREFVNVKTVWVAGPRPPREADRSE